MSTDSIFLFDTSIKQSTLSEKRQLIGIAAIRYSYTNNDLSKVAHSAFMHNIATVFAKLKADSIILRNLMATGRISHAISQRILPQ